MWLARTEIDARLDALAERARLPLEDGDVAARIRALEDAVRAIDRHTALSDRAHLWQRALAVLRAHGSRRLPR